MTDEMKALAELGLPLQFEDVVRDHMEFYRAKSRIEALKQRLTPSDTKTDVLRRMLAVCAGAEGALDTVIEELLDELADERDDAMRLMERSGLTEFIWKQVENAYGYRKDTPDFQDFAIDLFKSCYARALGEDGKLNGEALLVFRRWKNNWLGAKAFETLSGKYQDVLRIPEDVQERDIRALMSSKSNMSHARHRRPQRPPSRAPKRVTTYSPKTERASATPNCLGLIWTVHRGS